MPEATSPLLIYLLCGVIALLLFLIVISWNIVRGLAKIERRLSTHQNDNSAPSTPETSPSGAFEAFLNEEPAIKKLPKGEQFAAYRKWRQEKGLNWSGS